MSNIIQSSDLVVLSHLKWDFVFQRPQHLMSRFAKYRRVFFIEPPVTGKTLDPSLHVKESKENVQVVIPHIPAGFSEDEKVSSVKKMLQSLIEDNDIIDFTSWYFNPMALMFTHHLKPSVVIYDCMDELSGFKDCPQEMRDWEKKLLEAADIVFTGGNSLYEAKKSKHHNIHPFPSSIDYGHFHKSRTSLEEPADQKNIPHPRVGFYGVIEERINLDLLFQMAQLRPDIQFIMVGPIIRLEESQIPQLPNIHYLGMKDYIELPNYLSGWDCAMMPFAMNEATRFISPTKTPEFLAAGKPVVSTPVHDVVHPYAKPANLIHIANNPEDFLDCIDDALLNQKDNTDWLSKVDKFLHGNSWDNTFLKMADHEAKVRSSKLNFESVTSGITEQSLSNNF